MFKLALGGNILAPINSDPKRIIDIGAGSGI
jgi:16S rRNA G527 N7-methylase RsmG